jgi:hypothetical protein
MQDQSDKERFLQRVIIVSFLFFGGLFSCSQKPESTPVKLEADRHVSRVQTQNKAEYSSRYTKFYIDSIPEDFILSSAKELEEKFNFNVLKDVGFGEGGSKYTTLRGEGIQLDVDSESGSIRNVVLRSSKHSVETGGRVGMSRKDITEIYQSGTYQNRDGKTDTRCYLYLEQLPETTIGMGFRFYFDDRDRVESISIGPWSFAP